MTNLKLVFVGDTHFHDNKRFSKPTDDGTINTRFREQLEVMQNVFDYAREQNAVMVFGGDVFHKRNAPNTPVFNSIYRLFYKNNDIHMIIIPGNHDNETNDMYSESSLDVFDYIPNIEVKKGFCTTELNKNCVLYSISYTEDFDDIREHMSNLELDLSKTNILSGHIAVDGSKSDTGASLLTGIPYSDLQAGNGEFDYIRLAHFHRRQSFKGNPNHGYIGSLFSNTFGEIGEKGVDLITVHKDKSKNTLEFIEVPSTKFVTIDADKIDEYDNLDEIISNNYIRYRGTPEQVKALTNSVDTTENIEIDVQKDYSQETRLDVEETATPAEISKAYAEKYMPEAKDEILECIKEVQ